MVRKRVCDHDAFMEFWRGLPKGTNGVPKRSSLNPAAIPTLLPYLFLLERTSRTSLEVRIMGTALDGFETKLVRGSNFFNVYQPYQRDFYYQLIADMCEHPCGSMMSRTVRFSDGSEMTVGSITLPMTAADGDVRYLTGVAEAPTSGQLHDTAAGKRRIGSDVTNFHYFDIGNGVPASPPVFPKNPGQT